LADYNFSGVKVPEDDSKELYGLRYAEFVVPIVKSIQELEAKCEELEAEKNSATDLLGKYEEIICEQEDRLRNYEALLLKVDARLNGLEQEMANIRLGGSSASK
jgi:chromosome segregation ATPase